MLRAFDEAVVKMCEAVFPPSPRRSRSILTDDCRADPELIVPQAAVSRCIVPKLVVFDVDKTLLRSTDPLAGVQQASSSAVHQRQAKFVDWHFLGQLCTALCQRQHKIGVATFCDAYQSYFSTSTHVADELVELLDGVLPFCRPYLQDDAHIVCGSPPRRSTACKNEHLQHMQMRFQTSDGVLFERSNVVLIDDSAENVATARAGGFGAFCCPNGLTREWFAAEYHLQYVLGLSTADVLRTPFAEPDAPLCHSQLPPCESWRRRHVPNSLSSGSFEI